jgi:hypothetical protein
VAQARAGIAAYFQFFNHERLHQALSYRTLPGLHQFAEARQVRELGHRAHRLASSSTAGQRGATRSGLGCGT